MSAQDIKAGRAYVELMLNDSKFIAGLRKASQRLKDFGSGVARIGAGIAGAGAAIMGPLLAAVNQFASVGDKLDKMSLRTGIAASALAELGFAAEQSGTNIEAIENAVRKMQKTLGDANRGSRSAAEAFTDLGLSLSELNSMSPEDQFQSIADQIAKIEDPSKRAAAAMQIFGSRQGTALLPMLESLRELREEAQDLGLAPSDDSVKAAAAVTDAFNRIRRAVGAVVYEIGYALSDVVLEAAMLIKNVVVTVGRWVKQNHALVKTLFAVGAGLSVAGTALVSIGTSIFFAGIALAGLASAIALVGTAVSFLLQPWVLVGAAIVAGVAALALFTSAGQRAVAIITKALQPLLRLAQDVFGGIYDAIASGNLELAAEIAMAGIKVVFLRSVAGWTTIFGDFFGRLATQIANADFSGAWNTVVLQLSDTWAQFTKFIVTAFTDAARAIIQLWGGIAKAIQPTLKLVAAYGGKVGKLAVKGFEAFNDNVETGVQFAKPVLNLVDAQATQRSRNAAAANRNNTAGGTLATDAALSAAEAELMRLREEARVAVETARANRNNQNSQLDGLGADRVVGSFSAAAIQAQGGASPMERIVAEAKRTADEIKALRAIARDSQRLQERMLHEIRIGGVFT